jgi:hypothetical protein
MRACRQFLAGIPLSRVGHPCVTHPSATPSASEKTKVVRLACVRHAASVYPEPGSNSPSVVSIFRSLSTHALCMYAKEGSSPRSLSCDPGQAVICCTWLFADSCSRSLQNESLLFDRNWCMRLRVYSVAVLLSTLQLSRCYRKQVSLASLSPFGDKYTNPGTTLLHKRQKILG